ncbi:MAG: ATP-dependent RecD-like DNA helicase [Armatimonadetes bacterium]|nr:ATP-dependent RecD-like DNA helicase [Armatimonadota bacterium]
MDQEAALEGILERIVYFNEESNYTVAKLRVKGEKELVTVVGNLLAVHPGETLKLQGKWVNNPKFGRQFKADSCLPVLPATLTGIEKYLGSGLIKGIGPVMARRLTKKFGLQTLEIIENNPDRLNEVEGIGPVRVEWIKKAWAEQKEIKEVILFLQSHGVSTAYAVKIYKAYGNSAIALLRENPYRLAMEISGIGFKTADRIARNLGVPPDSPLRAQAGILYLLWEATEEGHVFLPREELVERAAETLQIGKSYLEDALAVLVEEEKVVLEEEGGEEEKRGRRGSGEVYLKPLWMAEEMIARRLHRLSCAPRFPLPIDAEKAIAWVQDTGNLALAEKQKEAIRQAVAQKVLVITGGPGTGKTTLVKSILRVMEKKGQRIVLASPTGRAAKRLSEVTGREAKTIHRLLEYKPKEGEFARNEESPLAADLVIVDETSMVDVLLMNHLLKAIPPQATLILAGDVDQLPSVGPGNVLKDVINSGTVTVITLTEIFRQARQSMIVVNAHRVNRGEFPLLKNERGGDFYFIEKEDPEEALQTVKELCAQRIPGGFGFHPVNDIQVLSPLRKGSAGVERLNAELQALLNPRGPEVARGGRLFRLGDKVMQIKNNYEKEVFNGDIGRIARINPEEQEIQVQYEDRRVSYDYSDLDELVLAYAISVHKSQGSEYPAVVLPLLKQHFVMLQRNLLYTAITRAKKLLVIVGDKKALAMAVRNARPQERYTSLQRRLKAQMGSEK